MKFILAAVGGAVVGAGCALLFAPQTGRATRAMLRDKATKYGTDAREFVEGKTRHFANKARGYRHKADEMLDQGLEMLDHTREAFSMESPDASRRTEMADV